MRFHNTKILIPAALAVGVLSLTGCSEGTSQSSEPALKAAPEGTKSIVRIANLDNDQPFARAILVDKNGNIVASQNLDCKKGDNRCEMYLKTDINQPVTLFVQNKQGQTLAASTARAGSLTRETLYPDNVTTGLYLLDQLEHNYLAKEGIPLNEFYTRLQSFFQNYKSASSVIDFNEALGDYYANQLVKNPNLTDKAFLQELVILLKNGGIAKPEDLQRPKKQSSVGAGQKIAGSIDDLMTGKTKLLNDAHAQTTCTTGLAKFLQDIGMKSSALPIAGGVVSGIARIAANSCLNEKMDNLSMGLGELSQSLDRVSRRLAEANGLAQNDWINTETQNFKNGRELVIQAKTEYQNFLNNNLLSDGTVSPSLKKWFADKGGWKKALENETTKKAVLEVMTSMNGILSGTEGTTSITSNESIKTYFQALNQKCNADLHVSDRNFIAVRQQCNNALLVASAYVVSYRESLPMAKDIFETAAIYHKDSALKADVYNSIKFPIPDSGLTTSNNIVFTDYETAYNQTVKVFDAQQTKFLKDLRTYIGHNKNEEGLLEGYFDAYHGLPDGLVDRIRVVCNSGYGNEGVAAITGWYMPRDNVADHYITTLCKIHGNSEYKPAGRRVAAKYYYSGQKPDVINVMGVLVNKAYAENAGLAYDNRISWEPPPVPLHGITSPGAAVHFYAPELLAFSTAPYNTPLASPKIIDDAYIPAQNLWFDANTPQTFSRYHHVIDHYKYDFISKVPFSKDQFPVWLLFQDSQGYHHVVTLSHTDKRWIGIACKTPDCRVIGNGSDLAFKNNAGTGNSLHIDITETPRAILAQHFKGALYQLGPHRK